MTSQNGERPRSVPAESHTFEERPMIASGNDFADLVDALRNHTAAITSLVATLAPEVPDLVGTTYVASRLGVSTTWVCRLADNGDIPKACMAPRLSGGRIRRFFRDKVDQWLSEKGHG